MTTRKTCDKCQHYEPCDTYDGTYPAHGACAKTLDWNDVPRRHGESRTQELAEPVFVDQVAGWDYESYSAGVYVAPKFGCIHWARIEPATQEKTK